MSEPRGRPLPRRLGVALAGVPLVAVLLFDAALLSRQETPNDSAPARPSASTSTNSEARSAQVRTAEIRDLLARRSHAVLHHDAKEWLSTVDPEQRKFRRQQARAFANLREVPFASWNYAWDPATLPSTNARTARYRAPVWAPAEFSLQ